MNCKVVQEKITDSFADDETVLSAEVASHQESCAACRDFEATQRELFRFLDAGLESLVNEPVPPSLLPRVRARLDEARGPGSSWNPRWNLVALAASALLVFSVAIFWRHPGRRSDGPDVRVVALRGEEHSFPATPRPSRPASGPAKENHVREKVTVAHETAPEPSLEVIVLPEEREAFAKFVAQLPEETDVAVALTRAAPEQEDPPLEIALLQIEEVQVKPLEATARE